MVIDWNAVLGQILQAVLMAFAVSVLPGLLIWLAGKAGKAWREFKAQEPGWAAALDRAAYLAVTAAEQLRKSGVLPTGEDAKEYAIEYIDGYLKKSGIKGVNLEMIVNAIEAAVHNLPKTEITASAVGYNLPADADCAEPEYRLPWVN